MYSIFGTSTALSFKNILGSGISLLNMRCAVQSSLHKNIVIRSKVTSQGIQGLTSPRFHDVPQIPKDVLLYMNNNKRFFRYATLCGVAQCIFWTYLATWVHEYTRDVDSAEEMKFATTEARPIVYKIKEALDFEDKYKHGLTALFTILGCGFFIIPTLWALRSVQMIVLRKGGLTVDVVTFALFGTRRTIAELPLDRVSCQQSMHTDKSQLALKIKGRAFYFLVDKGGVFPNPKLFEQTVGLFRK